MSENITTRSAQEETGKKHDSNESVNIRANTLGGAASAGPADHLANTQISRFPSPGGTGFAAEDANTLNDKIRGRSADVVGGDNAKNGADRVVDGQPIQTKYHSSASSSVGDSFDANGMYRYGDMPLEVPSDQYDEALRIMRKRIADGRVPGFSDPADADKLVKKGSVTYKQAYNIARAGNVDSLVYDAKNSAVVSTHVFAIGFVISFAKATWEGRDAKDSIRVAVGTGLQGAGTSFVASVVSSQLMRTQSARVGTTLIRSGLEQAANTDAGKATIQKIAEVSAGKALHGGAAINHVSKLLRNNVITGVVTTTVLTAPDVYRAAFKSNTSWAQVGKNLLVNGLGVAAGTAGWMGGSVAGAAAGSVFPVVGTAIGATVGGLAGAVAAGWGGSGASKYLLDHLIEDDANEMIAIVQEGLIQIAEDYLLTEAEFIEFGDKVRQALTIGLLREMYAEKDRAEFVVAKFEDNCKQVVKARKPVVTPQGEEIRLFIESSLADEAEASVDYTPETSGKRVDITDSEKPNFVLVPPQVSS